MRAVEEEEKERVRRGNAGERYLFHSLEVKRMEGDKLDIAMNCRSLKSSGIHSAFSIFCEEGYVMKL